MRSFRKMFNSKRKFKICLFEGENQFWPVVDGWTQHLCDHYSDEQNNIKHYEIDYFNDKKNFYVRFSIDELDYFPNNFTGIWSLNDWGQDESGVMKSEKSIKPILKKCESLFDKFKVEGMKKIPDIPEWKKVVNDYEIAYSRKQNKRTVIVKLISHNSFIRNGWIGCKISVYVDEDIRYVEQESYEESNRAKFKKLMSDLNDRFFKK